MKDSEIAAAIRILTQARAPASICPSEVAMALADEWKPLMPEIRRVAAQMDEVKATQHGVVVSPLTAKGPIRLTGC